MTELTGLYPAPLKKHEHEGAAYPKWTIPHPSHIARDGFGNPSVPDFPFHIDRVRNYVVVLVNSAAEEEKVKSPKATS